MGSIEFRDVSGTKGWVIDGWQQWTSLFNRCNWYDLTLIHIGGEWGKYMGRWEFEVILLGFGFRIQYVYDDEPVKRLMSLIPEGFRDGMAQEKETQIE